MKKKIKNEWVVLKYDVQPNEFVCERCGDKQVMPQGSIRFSMFEAIGNAFMKIHKKCKPKPQADSAESVS